jgi:hypothetical protein
MSQGGEVVAGMGLGGGRRENFFFCVLQYFEKDKRWFLKDLRQVKDEAGKDGDFIIKSWVTESNLQHLIVDFPLTDPACDTCQLDCPGVDKCPHPVVTNIRTQMNELLTTDQKRVKENPKRYEQERNEDDLVSYSSTIFDKETHHHILSKSFKRKLKKGFVPYWNRSIDFWVWLNYYDQILNVFNISYDSFGTTSVMLIKRFHYLKRHFPDDLGIFEGNTFITLIELFRAGVISKKNIMELQDISLGTLARLEVVRAIEKKLGIFIYERDMESIVKNPRAFDSFLLSVSGTRLLKGEIKPIPDFNELESPRFIAPQFGDGA